MFKFYRFAGIQPEDLEEDEERRTPHSATNSTGSPPHRRDSPKDLGMGKKIGIEVGKKELRDQTRGKEDRMRTTKGRRKKGNAGRGHRRP